MRGALGALVSVALGLGAAPKKKGPAKRGRADDPEVGAVRDAVADNEEDLPPSSPRRVKARGVRGSNIRKRKAVEVDPDELEEAAAPLRTPSGATDKRARVRKSRKRKSREADLEEFEADAEDLVTPPPHDADAQPAQSRSRGARGNRDKRARIGDAMLNGMTAEQRNIVLFGIYQGAHQKLRASGRERFSKKDIVVLRDQIRGATGESDLTWEAIQKRMSRMLDKASYKRAPGSGRKRQ